MKQFEYEVIELHQSAGNPYDVGGTYINSDQRRANLRAVLNELGGEGWEFMGVNPEGQGIVKREITHDEE